MAQPIEERFLGSRDLFALRYNEGLVFLEVEEFEDTTYEEFSNLEDVESGTSLDDGFQRLEDSNQDDLLFVPSEDNDVILHVGIGIAPSVIEMFISYPEGSRNLRDIPNLSTNPTPGANFGMIDGDDSPYRSPTGKGEVVVPPDQRVSFNFRNPSRQGDSHEPLLRLAYRKYRINVLPPDDEFSRDAIRRIIKPGSPAPIFQVGNFTRKAEFNLDHEWDVEPVRRNEARNIVEGRGEGGRANRARVGGRQ